MYLPGAWHYHRREAMHRNERGNAGVGCLILLVIIFAISGCLALVVDGESDCYATPGAEPGSAQAQRDVERCLGQ